MASNSTSLAYPGGYNPATLSISASVSGSTISATASLYNNSSWWYAYGNTILSIEVDGSTIASDVVAYSASHQTYTVSGSISKGDGSHTVTARFSNPNTSVLYICNSGTVSVNVSISTSSSGSFRIGESSVSLTESQTLALSNGNNNSFTSVTWSCNGYSGSLPTSSYTWSMSNLESYVTNINSSTTVTITANQQSHGSITRTFTLTIPPDYLPTIKLSSIEKKNVTNYSLIAGQSSFDIFYETGITPSSNAATVSSVIVASYTVVPNAGAITFTVDAQNDKVSSSVLPSIDPQLGASYTVKVTLLVTDSRNRTASVTVDIGTVFGYVPPYFNAIVERCTSTGSETPAGKYAKCTLEISNPDDSVFDQVQLYINDTITPQMVDLDFVSKTGTTSTYTKIVGNNLLLTSEQYKITFYVKNRTMTSYQEAALYRDYIIATMQMPISLFDDTSQVGVSIGEMAKNHIDLGGSNFINFAKGLKIRLTNPDDDTDIFIDDVFNALRGGCPYNVGDIYITTLSSDPSTIWSGTTWSQIEDTFLLACGNTYTAGEEGGEAEHTLTVQEIPSHTHRYINQAGSCDRTKSDSLKTTGVENDRSVTTDATGGGQAHNNMPPYLVVYMWQRIS